MQMPKTDNLPMAVGMWMHSAENEIKQLRADLAAAERRGAERMRERCAEVAERLWPEPHDLHDAIRALPLPGDEG